jgi:Asp/Glu/hydantoin racemase
MTTEIIASKVTLASSAVLSGAGAYFAVTDAVSISIITSLSAVAMAFVSAYFSYKAKSVSEETHKLVNSRMGELLELAKSSSKAEGKLEGKQEARTIQDRVDLTRLETENENSAKQKETK